MQRFNNNYLELSKETVLRNMILSHWPCFTWKLFIIWLHKIRKLGTKERANVWDFWVFGPKFTKFLSFLKQQISFSSWDITPMYFFSLNVMYFQQKESIKVQIWWNFTWAVAVWNFALWWAPFFQIMHIFS